MRVVGSINKSLQQMMTILQYLCIAVTDRAYGDIVLFVWHVQFKDTSIIIGLLIIFACSCYEVHLVHYQQLIVFEQRCGNLQCVLNAWQSNCVLFLIDSLFFPHSND